MLPHGILGHLTASADPRAKDHPIIGLEVFHNGGGHIAIKIDLVDKSAAYITLTPDAANELVNKILDNL